MPDRDNFRPTDRRDLGIARLLGQVRLDSFLDLPLEELLTMEGTSVAKKKQQLNEAAAAIFVITQEDIQRSGVTSIPQALRMAPGIQVARIDANKWAISSRGFNAQFANKLLVLIDGRSVYTPSYSGVYWDAQDTLLEDIDRIEVIRGPNSATYGSNAFLGVISITTRHAAEDAGQYIFGYTAANDVTARDLQRSDNQWTRGKGFDTFCPLGPWIETSWQPVGPCERDPSPHGSSPPTGWLEPWPGAVPSIGTLPPRPGSPSAIGCWLGR